MDRAPGSSEPPRSSRVVASAVTHRSHALVRSVTLPEHAAQPTLTSTLPFVPAERNSSTRHSISSSMSGGDDPRVSVASSRGAAHAPAVWLFEDLVPMHRAAVEDDDDGEGEEGAGEEEDEGLSGRLGSGARRSRYGRRGAPPHLSRPWVVDAIEVQPDATAEALSPRVLDNRLLRVSGGGDGVNVTTRHHSGGPYVGSSASFSQPSIEEMAATSIPSHAAIVSAPTDDVAEDRRSAASTETTTSVTDTRTKTWASATAVREGKAQRRQHQQHRHHLHHRRHQRSASDASSSSSSSSEASPASPPSSAQSTRVDMPPSALTSLRLSGSTEHHHHHLHNRPSTSGPSPSSSISPAGDRLPLPRPYATIEDVTLATATVFAASASRSRASSVPSAAADPAQSGGMEVVEGLGPLLLVHLDVLPELRHHAAPASPSPSSFAHCESGWATTGGGSGPSALVVPLDPASRHGDPAAADSPSLEDGAPAALHALVTYEAADAHTRELTALHARLEAAESRARLAEQQVSATAEVRAAALVKDYKADERQRRAQFQSSLDALREENRDLTARLEAALRSPAVGLAPPTSSAVRVDGTPVGGGGGGVMVAATGAASSSSALPFADFEVARQVHAVEAYWRDRLRTAEHHWEEEMTRQSQQRREALDQVEELVRTVEQSQEELRYTRRQAARLREENVRLSSAATAASAARVLPTSAVGVASSSLPSSAGEVERLRRALKEHEHREAALLAQVESYGEEATQVRLRCEAAVERAQQDLAAERRRSMEMVKLYGSQLESLHHQLREAKLANASRQ